jgi:hypothetical protein
LAASLESDELKELVGAFGNRLFFGLLKLAPDHGTKKNGSRATVTTYFDVVYDG